MKKIAVVFLLLLIASGGVLYYLYGQLTYQPGWYADGKSKPQTRLKKNEADTLLKKAFTDLSNGKKVLLPVDGLVSITAAFVKAETGIDFQKAVKAMKTTITPTGIELEMMMDVLQLPADRLPKEAAKMFGKLVDSLPERSLKELYVRSKLNPVVENGALQLELPSGLSVGKMNLPLEKLEMVFGKKARIPLANLPVGDLRMADQALVLLPKMKASENKPANNHQ